MLPENERPLPIDISRFQTLLNKLPKRTALAYMEGHNEVWTKWTKDFLQYWDTSHPSQKEYVASEFFTKMSTTDVFLPKDLLILERLYDFGKSFPGYESLSELFHALMEKHRAHLPAKNFQSLLRKLYGASAFPKAELERYGHYEAAPSKELHTRLQNVWKDLETEKHLFILSEIPKDPDDMVNMLNKFGKHKIGIPENWPTFLDEVFTQFHQDEDWDDIHKAIKKLKEKRPDWAKKQTYFQTR